MNPKKAKQITLDTAKELDLNLEMVEDVISFYWDHVYNILSGIEDIKVQVDNLGSFFIKPWTLEKVIKQQKSVLDNRDVKTFEKFGKYDKFNTRLNKLHMLDQQYVLEKRRKEIVKEKRNGKQFDSIMEE